MNGARDVNFFDWQQDRMTEEIEKRYLQKGDPWKTVCVNFSISKLANANEQYVRMSFQVTLSRVSVFKIDIPVPIKEWIGKLYIQIIKILKHN